MVRNGTANGTAARSQAAEIDRLKRRLDRERLARREAEAIAERTTRGLYDEVAARTRELECIVDMGRELAQSLDDRGFADLIASHIARAVGFDECGIFAWDKIQDTVVTAGYHPAARRSALIDVYPLDDYPETRRVLMSGQRSITDPADPTADSSEVSFLLGMGGKLMIQLPMNVGGRTIGTVELISLSGQMLSDRQIDLAQSMASEAGVMLENARLYAEVRHQAFHDHLTGLPNRALLGDRMEHALARGRAPKLPLVGLVFVDVDDFKVINDSHGHEVGDRALIAISQRLQQLVRSGDTVARFSGDEFAILIEDLESPEDAHLAARRVVRAFQKPLTVAGREITMSVSVGVDVGNALSTTPEDLVRNADFAMYIAKASGKSQHEVYQASARAAADDGAKMRSDLRGAVRRGELRLHYQPIIELRSGRIRSFEALILEMTETILVADPGAERVLRELQNLGVRLAIDDFGTGYASISYLRRFAVDILKIDREFTDAVDTAEGTALLGGITQLGRSLGLELVAEGIERPRQAELVRNAGCDLGQGFLFARPAPPEDAAALLRPGGLPIQASSITS